MERKAKFKLGQPVYWYYGKCIYIGKIRQINREDTETGTEVSYYTNYEGYFGIDRRLELIRCSPQPFSGSFEEDELFLSEEACEEALKKYLKQAKIECVLEDLQNTEISLHDLERVQKELPEQIKKKKLELKELKKKLKGLKEDKNEYERAKV